MLLELDPSKIYRYTRIRSFLIEKGLTFYSADEWVKVFVHDGVLKRVDQGLYMIDVERIKRELEELEKKKEKEVEYA